MAKKGLFPKHMMRYIHCIICNNRVRRYESIASKYCSEKCYKAKQTVVYINGSEIRLVKGGMPPLTK